jgi:hypothetical protein
MEAEIKGDLKVYTAAFEMEDGATRQGMKAASGSWERQGKGFLL